MSGAADRARTGLSTPRGSPPTSIAARTRILLQRELNRVTSEQNQIHNMHVEYLRLRAMQETYEAQREELRQTKLELDRLRKRCEFGSPSPQTEQQTTQPQSVSKDVVQRQVIRPRLNRATWSLFKMEMMEKKEISVIDVLDGSRQQAPGLQVNAREPAANSAVTTKHVVPGQAPLPERIRINPKHIASMLRQILEDKGPPDQIEAFKEAPFVMIRPYKALVSYSDSIQAKPQALEARFENGAAGPRHFDAETYDEDEWDELTYSQTAYEHLRCLVCFMDTEIEQKLAYLNSHQCQMVTFADTWHLFKPGDLVLDQARRQTYRIYSIYSTSHKHPSPYRKSRLIGVNRFEGAKAATALEVFPLRFAELEYRGRLIARGRLFVDMTTYKHMHYSGFTLDMREDVDIDVVVDFEEAFSHSYKVHAPEENWRPQLEILIEDPPEFTSNDDSIACEAEEETNLADEDLIIMSYLVFGFITRNRKWAKLDLKSLGYPRGSARKGDRTLSPVPTECKSQTAFDQLVLPKGHREMVQSLIAQHFRDKELASKEDMAMQDVDIVRGKGKGLILLLHGAPGVGKTTTAGDLGTTASEVEKALETNFALANRWECILLLDGADVFLVARSKEDFNRNESLFLRVLEYYAGVLFLTTNRIGDFDEAFTSRIHISLYYPHLDLTSTEAIFGLNLRLIRDCFSKSGRPIEIEEDRIIDFVRHYFETHKNEKWNGRQIRNACQTALALAEYRAQRSNYERVTDTTAVVRLEVDNLRMVSNSYLQFMKYLNEVRGKGVERWAKQMSIRAREMDVVLSNNDEESGENKGKPEADSKEKAAVPDRQQATLAVSEQYSRLPTPLGVVQQHLVPPGSAAQGSAPTSPGYGPTWAPPPVQPAYYPYYTNQSYQPPVGSGSLAAQHDAYAAWSRAQQAVQQAPPVGQGPALYGAPPPA
ncbi:uncharacterized protein B0T15DRAFT_572501 [Chaetomium strumarium]|uniref:AAA+ ATPase domain-containing protein n=1 Tax=Chaetomium strumarium TaxID=1170767 RepID=A0AAJ0M440_9PEZI|nr:hypothetical protein B0T15DRAFT_572501 [Chaetomium strumarium]